MALAHTTGLCRKCSTVDFGRLARVCDRYTEQGCYDEFWSPTTNLSDIACPLCRFVFKTVLQDTQVSETGLDYHAQVCGRFTRHECRLDVYPRKGGAMSSSYSIQLSSSKHRDTLKHLQGSRKVYYDYGQLSTWLEDCSNTHPECQPSQNSAGNLPVGFHLIDVQRRCIVVAPQDPTYCALSYVWGGAQQVLLNTTNVEKLKEENSLGSESVPKTILDAMELCRRIKRKYLWVDSLCILRDTEAKFVTQIKSMDRIYNKAFLTIVAASGNDANSGIGPIRRSRSVTMHSESIQELDIFSAPSPQAHAEKIARSKWVSRGWTLQEYCLSRRALIFTEDFAFFRCQKTLRPETFGLDSLKLIEEPDWDLPIPPPVHGSRSRLPFPGTFQLMLADYIYRELGDEGDILNAFHGLLSFFESSIGAHHFGLPLKEFGVALQWHAGKANATTRRAGFPSWSWAGWHFKKPRGFSGPSNNYWIFPHVDPEKFIENSNQRGLGRQMISTISLFEVGKNGKAKLFANQNLDFEQRLIKFVRAYSKDARLPDCFVEHFTVNGNPPDQNINHSRDARDHRMALPTSLSQCVGFWTSYAQIPTERKSHSNSSGNSRLARFKLLLPGVLDGFVDLLPEWRAKQPDNTLHCIVTAVAHEGKMWGKHEHRMAFLILIIEPQDDGSDTFSRVIASELCLRVDEWEEAGPRKRWINLV